MLGSNQGSEKANHKGHEGHKVFMEELGRSAETSKVLVSKTLCLFVFFVVKGGPDDAR